MNAPQPHRADTVRDHLANERTFLAWVRTSIALLGFGVVIAKLRFLAIDVAAAPTSSSIIPPPGEGGRSILLGLLFCLVGILTLIFSVVHYTQARRRIDEGNYIPAGGTLVAFVVVVAVLAIASVAFLLELGH